MFRTMHSRQVPQFGFAFPGQVNGYLSPIAIAGATALDQMALFQPVKQANGAVMANQEMSCKTANRRSVIVGEGLDGQQHLVLVRFQSLGASGLFTEVQEFPNLVAEIAEGSITTVGEVLHINIVSRYYRATMSLVAESAQPMTEPYPQS